MITDIGKYTLEIHERRAVMVSALVKSFDIFTSHLEETFDKVMTEGMRPLADVLEVNRIIVNRFIEIEGKKRLQQMYRWDQAEGGLTNRSINILPNNQVVSKWIKDLLEDVCISKQVRDMPEDENAFLSIYGVKSILIVPVFIQGECWGTVVFQDHLNEREFDDDCTDLYRVAARILVTAVIRENMRQNTDNAINELKHSQKTADIVNKMAVLFLSQSEETFVDMMTSGMNLLVEMVDVDRISVWKNIRMPDGLHASQIYYWDKELGGTMASMAGLEDVTYDQSMPQWDESFEGGLAINSPVSLLPKVDVLKSLGAVSVFAAPVFFDNILWGFVIFEDRDTVRYFDNESAEMMRSAAFLCANAVMRAEMEYEIGEKNEFNRVLFNAAPVGLTTFDDNCNLVDCNDVVTEMHGITKQYYLDHFYELSPEYQPDGSISSEMAREYMKRTLNGEKVVVEWMHCSLSGESVPCEITLTRTRYKDRYFGVCYVYDLRNIKKLEKNVQRLESEVDKIFYDSLTNIYNRRFFDKNLNRVMKSLSRSGGVLGLMMVDIDNFKEYNDTYGHSEGDKCLKIVAETLARSITRADDFIARYGGEEFVVVLPNTDENGARLIAERLLKNVQDCKIPHEKNDVEDYVTISIGVTTSHVNHTQCADDYVKRADEMLYKSKHGGRNQYTFESF